MRIIKLSVTAVFCTMYFSCNSQSNPPEKGQDGFAIVELFTSEGCSSCPAAEAVLDKINREYKKDVYVMEFHVDYWNYLGWKDVFSSPSYTERQRHYASLFGLNSTYTPQAVVNGKAEMVGSADGKVHDEINRFLKQKAAHAIALSAEAGKGNIEVSYALQAEPNELLNIVLVQKRAETDVRRGENSGRKLVHINIVRSLTTVGNPKSSGKMNVILPDGLSMADVTIIAYTQNQNSWEITGAAEILN